MRAPSEKHLEDWIVENPDFLNFYTSDPVTILARQLRLVSGIPDLIARHGLTFDVVELKKGEIDIAAIAQLMRYLAELREVWTYAVEYLAAISPVILNADLDHAMISGTALGFNASEQVIDLACAAQITVVTYEFDGKDYGFTPHYISYKSRYLMDVASTNIGTEMRSVFGQLFQSRVDPTYDITAAEYSWQNIYEGILK